MIEIMFHVELWVCISIKIEVMISVNFIFFFAFIKFEIHLSESDYLFSSFAHFIEADYERWSSWNFFIRIRASFFIIVYDFHVLCLYSSHLIRSSNCASWIYHLMSSIESTKYEFSLLSTVTDDDSDICHLIRSCFKSSNKLTWNIECIFIFSNRSNSYA